MLEHKQDPGSFGYFFHTTLEMEMSRAWLKAKFNLSSFLQGLPGNDGLPGKPGLPGQAVSNWIVGGANGVLCDWFT